MALNSDNKPIFFSLPDHASGSADENDSAGSWNSDTNGIEIFTAPTNGAAVTQIIVTTDAAANEDIFLYILDGSEIINLGRFTIPDLSGTDGTEPVYNLLTNMTGLPTDQNSNSFLPVKDGAILKFSLQGTLGAGEVMEIACSFMKTDS